VPFFKGSLLGSAGGIYYQTWANYYLKFFQAYKFFNISFWGVTAQNEPSFGAFFKSAFNQLGFTPQTQAEFVISNLGPTLEQNGFSDIKIMILDDQRAYLPFWPAMVFKNTYEIRKLLVF
jgi:glucosylceramidase